MNVKNIVWPASIELIPFTEIKNHAFRMGPLPFDFPPKRALCVTFNRTCLALREPYTRTYIYQKRNHRFLAKFDHEMSAKLFHSHLVQCSVWDKRISCYFGKWVTDAFSILSIFFSYCCCFLYKYFFSLFFSLNALSPSTLVNSKCFFTGFMDWHSISMTRY